MATCKQLEELHTDYVCDLLDNERLNLMEEHLQDCPACVQSVESLKKVLSLTEEAGTILIPHPILNNLEVKVYKRLVVESSQPVPVHSVSRIFGALCSAWNWRIAVVCCILAVCIPVASIFFNRDRSADAPPNLVHIPSPQERVEQYKQKQIQANQEDALVAMHLSD